MMHRGVAGYASAHSSEALIEEHRWLLDRNARKIAFRCGDHSLADDFWSVGAWALISAAASYEPSRGVRFEVYAEHRIRGAMLDELRNMDHLPRRLRAKTTDLSKARQKLSQKLGRDPDNEELARHLGIELEDLAVLELAGQNPLPLEPELHSSRADDPERSARKKQQAERLAAAISALPERLQILLTLRYDQVLTLKEIALVLDLTEARVCQLHKEAIDSIKNMLSSG